MKPQEVKATHQREAKEVCELAGEVDERQELLDLTSEDVSPRQDHANPSLRVSRREAKRRREGLVESQCDGASAEV